jgi:hypothetical protein
MRQRGVFDYKTHKELDGDSAAEVWSLEHHRKWLPAVVLDSRTARTWYRCSIEKIRGPRDARANQGVDDVLDGDGDGRR